MLSDVLNWFFRPSQTKGIQFRSLMIILNAVRLYLLILDELVECLHKSGHNFVIQVLPDQQLLVFLYKQTHRVFRLDVCILKVIYLFSS